MIRRLKVQNLLSLRDVDVALPSFGVLVGPNAAGKSNLFRILERLKEPRTTWMAELATWKANGPTKVEVTASAPDIEYLLEADVTGRISREALTRTNSLGGVYARGRERHFGRRDIDPDEVGLRSLAEQGDETSAAAWALFESIRVFDLDPQVLRNAATVERTLNMGRRGERIAAVLDTLREEHPEQFRALEEALAATVPGFRQLTMPTVASGAKAVAMHEAAGLVHAKDASDGTLLLLAVLTLVHLPAPPRVICLEEPERGVHPRRLAELVSYLWSVVDRGTQVLVATHSPYLLDRFREDRECVIVVDRAESGSRFRPLTEIKLSPEQREAPLGEVWYSGVLGGVPGT